MAEDSGYCWERHPEAEAVFIRHLDSCRKENVFLADFERGEGYKGFNRKNVSAIIREADPRKD